MKTKDEPEWKSIHEIFGQDFRRRLREMYRYCTCKLYNATNYLNLVPKSGQT